MEAVLSEWESQMAAPSAGLRFWRQKVTSRANGGSQEQFAFANPAPGALPGIVITTKVAAAEDQRRTIQGMFIRFATEREISKATLQSATALLSSLPSEAALPRVTVDDGGVLMAWAVAGKGRTLVTVVDNVVHAVANSGTHNAVYFADIPFDGTLPSEVLSAIPR
jgi:hypothetical protein